MEVQKVTHCVLCFGQFAILQDLECLQRKPQPFPHLEPTRRLARHFTARLAAAEANSTLPQEEDTNVSTALPGAQATLC